MSKKVFLVSFRLAVGTDVREFKVHDFKAQKMSSMGDAEKPWNLQVPITPGKLLLPGADLAKVYKGLLRIL